MRRALFGLLVIAVIPRAEAKPGTRALALEIDRKVGRLVIGDRPDRLPSVGLRAVDHGARILLVSEVEAGQPAPTKWAIYVEHVNPHGFVVHRELPILGPNLPPLAVEVERPPRGLHLKARLTIDCGRFEGAESATIFVPELATPIAPEPPSVAMVIDGREARLPLSHARVTFDLDVPATVTLKVRDERGVRWVRRAISAAEVVRPSARRPPTLSLDQGSGSVRVGEGLIPVPHLVATVLESGLAEDRAWARIAVAGEATAWRVRFGTLGSARVVERFGTGAPPSRIDVAASNGPPDWVEVETQSRTGARSTTGRVAVGRRGAPLGAIRGAWLEHDTAGSITRVGTSTGAFATLAVPEDF